MKSLYRMSVEDHLIKEDVNYTVQDALELATIERENEAACDAVEDSVAATAMLTERMTINSKLSVDPAAVTEDIVQSSNECLAYCLGKLNVDSQTFEQIRISREAGTTPYEKLQISTEGIGKLIKKVFKAIGDVLKWIWETIKKFFISIFRLFGFFKSKKKKKKKQKEDKAKAIKEVKKEVAQKVKEKIEKEPATVAEIKAEVESIITENVGNVTSISKMKEVFDNYTKLMDEFKGFKDLDENQWMKLIYANLTCKSVFNFQDGNRRFNFFEPLCVEDSTPKIDTIRSMNKAMKEAEYPKFILKTSKYFIFLFDLDFEMKKDLSDEFLGNTAMKLMNYKEDIFSSFFYNCAYKHFNMHTGAEGVLFLVGIDLENNKARFKYFTKKDKGDLAEVEEETVELDYTELGNSKFISMSDMLSKVDSNYSKQLEDAITFDVDTGKAEKIIKQMLDNMEKQYKYLSSKNGNTGDTLNSRPTDSVEAIVWDKNVAEMNSYAKLVNGLQSSTMGIMQYYKYTADILSLYLDMVNVEVEIKQLSDQFGTPIE